MYFTTFLSLISLGAAAPQLVARNGGRVTGKLGDAKVIKNNPRGAVYEARLHPNAGTDYDVSGYVRAYSSGPGKPVEFDVVINGLPKEGGPFPYHIHDQPVKDGNCTTTLAHLDPFIRGEDPVCDASEPETCQVGDLSGKQKEAKGRHFSDSYTDKYVSLREGVGAYAGNRSITVHLADKTRIACGNFEELWGGFEESNYKWGEINSAAAQAGAQAASDATRKATNNALAGAFAKLRNGGFSS